MQIDKINTQNFQSIKIDRSKNLIFERLNTSKRYLKFIELDMSQAKNPYNINITADNNNILIGKILNNNDEVVFTAQENKYKGILNLSPIKFIKDLCKKADKLNKDNA